MKIGSAPFITCSTRGFRPFSSFTAKVDGLSIDRQMKRISLQDKSEKSTVFLSLWRKYIAGNPHLAKTLREASGLFDPHASKGEASVAEALWQIRAELLEDIQCTQVTKPPNTHAIPLIQASTEIQNETQKPFEDVSSESKISDSSSNSTLFPGLKLKEISVMVSSKKAMNFNSLAFSYSVTAETELNVDFIAAIDHIKAQLLAKVESDHTNSISILKRSIAPLRSSQLSPQNLGHIN